MKSSIPRFIPVVFFLGLMPGAPATFSGELGEVLDQSGLSGGLCVQIGGADVAQPLRLHERGGLIVHRLDTDPDRVAAVRETVISRGVYGAVSAERWSGDRLPYVDNLINLIVCESPDEVAEGEILRVLSPGGIALLRQNDHYRTLRKTRPKEADEWTHQWHGPDGGLVTNDRTVGVPAGLQWVHGPLFAMAGRKSSAQSLVSSDGGIFCITQNVVENLGKKVKDQYLVARDAYNGLLLWKRPWRGPFTRGSGQTNPRIVAYRGLVYTGVYPGVEVLDAATGEPVRKLEAPEPVASLMVSDGRLLVQFDSGLQCHQVASGGQDPLWRFSDKTVFGTVVSEQRVFCLLAKRLPDGRRRHELVCLGLDDGALRWRVATQEWADSERLRICFADGGYVALIAHGHLHLLRAENGEHLWGRTTKARPGKSYSDERYVGHFYRHGLVWMQMENSPRKPQGQAVWLGLDPQTGEQKRRLETAGRWPRTAAPAKMGCQLMIASDAFIMIPRQATFVDFETGRKNSFKFIRGGCGLGFVPANGLVYSSPHACGCYSEAVRGLLAAHSRPTADPSRLPLPKERLQRYSERAPSLSANQTPVDDWPMYRRDAARSGRSPARISDELTPRWKVRITTASDAGSGSPWQLRAGMPVSPPVVADGLVYASDVQGHQVVAIDDRTGKICWRFTAGGRIDSPPTIFNGRCLFGSHDGYVYCLSAKDGQLLWRYLAAPEDRRIVAYGQLESPWPVAGTVLVQDGTAYAAAGRAPDADGGVTVVALDATTGKQKWTASVSDDMVGMCDYLIGDGTRVFLANRQFDPDTGESRAADNSAHLRGGKAGLLEASWTVIDLALRKSIQDWTARGVSGQLLSFDDQQVFGYRTTESGEAALFGVGARQWRIPVPAPRQVRALAATDGRILSGGANQRFNASEGGFLWVHESNKGRKMLEISLPAPPVVDGLAVAGGRVYVSLQNGELFSLGAPQ